MNLFSNYFDKFLSSPITIRLFFIFSFIFLATIVTFLVFLISFQYEQKSLNSYISNQSNVTINSKKNIFKNKLDTHRKLLRSLKNNTIFKQYLLSDFQSYEKETISLFQQIIQSSNDIMQLRYIDKNGKENIRLERTYPQDTATITPKENLQNKQKHYYFQEVSKLPINSDVWISNLDLNIENGAIEIPYKPTLRLAIPIYDKDTFNGIIIINLFMEDILKQISTSELFAISLLDKDGYFIIGKHESNGKLEDYSWSKYLLKQITIKDILPDSFQNVLNSFQYHNKYIFSQKISKELKLREDITLLLQVKSAKVEEIKDATIHKILEMIGVMLLISAPIGILLAYIPSILATKIEQAKQNFKEKSHIYDKYLDAMNVNNIISKSDIQGRITYINENFTKVSGYTEEEAIGKPHSLLRHPQTPKHIFKELWLTIQAGKVWTGILRNKKKNGDYYDVDLAIMPIFNDNHEIIEYLAVRHDITELTQQKKELLNIATTDSLTGFGNRYKLTTDIKDHIVNNIAVIDIDGFSAINDFYGHKVGDEILIKYSKLLDEHLTDEFLLYRLHGDKFAILNYTLGHDSFVHFIQHLNTQMIESVIDTDVKSFDIVTTVGISSQKNDTLLSTAEIANKHAKKINEKALIYSKELNIEKQFEENIKWTEIVKKGLSENRFIVYYQPIYNNKTQQIEKYESLIRLKGEDGKIISPYFFLDYAKSSGQYLDITKIVIQQSFKKFHAIDCEFSINLTIEDILNEHICNYLESMLEQYNIAEKLVLEIVESEHIEEFEQVQKFIKRIKSFGCKIAIDDFGTGYSNFEYLIKLNVDYVKIDGSLIKNISDPHIKDIIITILDFSHKMGYKTIAEFVSSKEIHHIIEELGFDYSQGYLFGAPNEELL